MFKNFFRGVASINAATYFEKSRMQATYTGDTSPPDEKDIQTLLKTLSGKDNETKASYGFQTLVNKLQTSDSRKYWNYLMKNLIILDRAVEDELFCKEISQLEIPGVEDYISKQQRYKERRIEELIASYFRFIKDKAAIYSRPKFSLNIAKDKRKQYFKNMDPEDILEESRVLNTLYNSAFEVFNTGSSGHLKYQLNQYVFLLVLSSIMNILSTQYTTFIVIIESFFDMESYMANECLRAFKEFLRTTEELISFTGNHQFIPGFQISLHELRNPTADAKLLNSMQEYIKMLEEESQGIVDRKATDPFVFNREELQPKKSEINIADFAGKFQAEKVYNEEEPQIEYTLAEQILSPNKNHAVEKMNENEVDDNDMKSSLRPMMSPQRSQSISFQKAFDVGFHGLVSVEEEEINKDILNLYKISDEERAKESNLIQSEEGSEVVDFHDQEVEKNLTPAFKKLLIYEGEDPIFAGFENYYSELWHDNTMNERISSPKKINPKITFDLIPCGVVLTKCENLNDKDENMNVIDFRQEIFNSFKNLYSNEFKM